MKKYICVLICMLLCVCLVGCSSATQKGEESPKAGQFYGKSVILKQLETNKMIDRDERSLDVFTSWKEWSSLYGSLTEEDRSKCSYDKDFFEDKDLLLIGFAAENEDRYALKQMEIPGEQLRVIMTRKERRISGEHTLEDVMFLHKQGMLIEIDKGSVPKDAGLTLIMEEGIYIESLGYISSVKKQTEEVTLEFEEAEWVRDETQSDQMRLVSKGEAAKIYNLGDEVQYMVCTKGLDSYNQTHNKKLEGKVTAQGGAELEEAAFLKYVEYHRQSGHKGSTTFWITVDEEQVVMIREEEMS